MSTSLQRHANVTSSWIAGLALAAMILPGVHAQETQESFTVRSEVDSTTEAGMETMLRGPLHEAFAEPIELEVKPTVVIRREPPEVIEELPPEVRPADDNAEWIPGYWAWDEDRDDYLWISGIWRVAPPGHRWVPGHWVQVDGGFQWVSGFWTSTTAEQVTYLPYPPESLEQGPNQPAPSDNYYWVCGQWMYRGERYVWRPGYWNEYQAGWTWNPSYYVWTPRGVIFVNGYWDYPFARRGTIFAPVYFTQPIYRRTGYYYSPSVAINITRLAVNMFVNPGYNHYYWGDYYASNYRQQGFYPWFQYGTVRRGFYDPMLAYYRTSYRLQGLDYDQRMRGWHNYYSNNPHHRPPRTFSDQIRVASQFQGNDNLQYALLGAAVGDLLSGGSGRSQFTRVPLETRRSIGRSADEIRQIKSQRQRIETAVAANVNADADPRADRKSGRAVAQADARLELPKVAATREPAVATAPATPELPASEQQAGDQAVGDAAKGRPEGTPADKKSDDPRRPIDSDKGKGKGKGRPGDENKADADRTRPVDDQKKSAPDATTVVPEAPASSDRLGPDNQKDVDTQKGDVEKMKKGNLDKAKGDVKKAKNNLDKANRDVDRAKKGGGRDLNQPGNREPKGRGPANDRGPGGRNRAENDPAAAADRPVTPQAPDAPVNPAPATAPAVPTEPMPKTDLPDTDVSPRTDKKGPGNANRNRDVDLPNAGRVDPTTPVLPPPRVDTTPNLDVPTRNTPRIPADTNVPGAGRRGGVDTTPSPEGRAGVTDGPRTTRNRVDSDSTFPPRPDGVVPPTARDGRRGSDLDSPLPPTNARRDTAPDPEGRAGVTDAPRTTRNRVDPDLSFPPRPDGVVPSTGSDARRGRNPDAAIPPLDVNKRRDTAPDPEGRAGVKDTPSVGRPRIEPDRSFPPRPDGVVPPAATESRRGRLPDGSLPSGNANPAPRIVPGPDAPRERANVPNTGRSLPTASDRSAAPPINRPAPKVDREPARVPAAAPPAALPTARSAPPTPPAPAPNANGKPQRERGGNKNKGKQEKEKE